MLVDYSMPLMRFEGNLDGLSLSSIKISPPKICILDLKRGGEEPPMCHSFYTFHLNMESPSKSKTDIVPMLYARLSTYTYIIYSYYSTHYQIRYHNFFHYHFHNTLRIRTLSINDKLMILIW